MLGYYCVLWNNDVKSKGGSLCSHCCVTNPSTMSPTAQTILVTGYIGSDTVLQSFEALKQTNEHGAEYWSARDLQSMLGYSQWRRFEDAIKRAMTSCETSGNNADYHFAGVGKMVELGSGSKREAGGLLGGVPKKSGKGAL